MYMYPLDCTAPLRHGYHFYDNLEGFHYQEAQWRTKQPLDSNFSQRRFVFSIYMVSSLFFVPGFTDQEPRRLLLYYDFHCQSGQCQFKMG